MDFRTAFDSAKNVAEQVSQCVGYDQPTLQASRLKQAGSAMCTAQDQPVAAKKRCAYALDLHGLLDTHALHNLRDTYYARPHVRLAPDPEPSDTFLSKAANQMRHRLLQVFPSWKVRLLANQVMADTKRRRVGDW